MGCDFEEVCWRNELLKEATHLVPPSSFPMDDPWERSQDTETIHELSQDSEEVDLKPQHNASSESQDSLTINANTTPKRLENTDICISPFHAGHMENTEGSFALLGESPKRRLGDSSAESSPKRIHLTSTRRETSSSIVETTTRSADPSDDSRYAVSRYTRVISVESTSENNGQIFNLEECHVVPRIMDGGEEMTPTTSTDVELNARAPIDAVGLRQETDIVSEDDLVDSDKLSTKARHASIDSAIDSGIGDSCNSVDSTEGKLAIESNEGKIDELERRCWQPKIKESLAARLPGKISF